MRRERGRGRLYHQAESRFWWCEFWLHGKQIRKSTGTDDPKKANRFLKAELDAVGADRIGVKKFLNPKTITFAAFAVQYIRDVLSQKAYSTLTTERSRIKNWLLPAFGNLQTKEMGPQYVQQFVAKGKHPKSTKNCIALLRMMWNSAKTWGYTGCDWFEGVTLPDYEAPESPFFTLDEMRAIIAAATGAFRTFVWLASETGMRLGELCALHVYALNLDSGVLVVRRSSWHGREGRTKAKKPRKFPLSPRLIERLQKQIAPVANDPEAFVFRSSNGTPWIGDDVVKRWLKPLLKELGIKQGVKRVGSHCFRHGNQTVMDSPAVAAPLKVRQERVGHSNEEMTWLYTHAEGAEHQAVAAKLGELLAPPEELEEMMPASPTPM